MPFIRIVRVPNLRGKQSKGFVHMLCIVHIFCCLLPSGVLGHRKQEATFGIRRVRRPLLSLFHCVWKRASLSGGGEKWGKASALAIDPWILGLERSLWNSVWRLVFFFPEAPNPLSGAEESEWEFGWSLFSLPLIFLGKDAFFCHGLGKFTLLLRREGTKYGYGVWEKDQKWNEKKNRVFGKELS